MARPPILNPLAIAFGSALKRFRKSRFFEDLPKTSITSNYYRLIESGQNHPSVAKAMVIARLFEPDISYEATAMFLAIIAASEEGAHLEDKEERARRIHSNVAEIFHGIERGDKLGTLLAFFLKPICEFQAANSTGLQEIAMSSSVLSLVESNDKMREVIDQLNLNERVFQFLSSQYASASSRGAALDNFFEQIPSVYKWLFDSLKESVMHLPTTFGAETSWQWESNNADKFGSFVGVGYRDHITSTENLERYNFQYLWQKDFGHATFVILDEDVETEDSLKKEFWKNLTDALQRSNDEMLVSRSASALKIAEKTTFVKVSDGHREKIEELLQSIPCDGTLPVNSLWFFRALGDGAIISAVSPIDPESKKASIIEFLTFSESRRLAWKIDEILEEYLLFPELRQSHAKIP